MKRQRIIIYLILPALVLGITGTVLGLMSLIGIDLFHNEKDNEPTESYTLYIGTNDKDTNLPVMNMEEAEAVVNDIAFTYAGGFTSYRAKGGWRDGETLFEEQTLVYVFVGIDRLTAEAIAADVCKALNQSSVLMERSVTDSKYYSAG